MSFFQFGLSCFLGALRKKREGTAHGVQGEEAPEQADHFQEPARPGELLCGFFCFVRFFLPRKNRGCVVVDSFQQVPLEDPVGFGLGVLCCFWGGEFGYRKLFFLRTVFCLTLRAVAWFVS